MTENPFEIPQTLRDLTEQNMKQAQAAYEQLAHFMINAMGTWTDALPANPLTAVFKDVQDRAMEIAMENSEVSVHVRRQDQQRTDLPRCFDASDAICSRPDTGLRHTDAGVSTTDRGRFPEAATRQISPLTRHASYGGQ